MNLLSVLLVYGGSIRIIEYMINIENLFLFHQDWPTSLLRFGVVAKKTVKTLDSLILRINTNFNPIPYSMNSTVPYSL